MNLQKHAHKVIAAQVLKSPPVRPARVALRETPRGIRRVSPLSLFVLRWALGLLLLRDITLSTARSLTRVRCNRVALNLQPAGQKGPSIIKSPVWILGMAMVVSRRCVLCLCALCCIVRVACALRDAQLHC